MNSPDSQRPRRSTIYDVAEAAGVSIATVSFSFSNTKRVAPKTRDRILTIAADLGYVPRGAARDLALGRTGVLGFWTYDFNTFAGADSTIDELGRAWSWPIFVDEVERGFRREAWQKGYAVLAQGSPGEESDALVRTLASRVDALGVMPNSLSPEMIATLAKQIPVVTIAERNHASPRVTNISIDNRAAMREIVTHLIQVHGAEDLRFIGGRSVDFLDRFAGFQDAMRDAGLTPPDAPEGGSDAAWHPGDSTAAVRVSLERGVPDAFVCASDLHAAHVLRALDDAGLRVPLDVAVTGFDDLQAAETARPPLTTVHQPMQEMGAGAVHTLLGLLDVPAGPHSPPELRSALVIRNSCGCP